MRAEGYRVWLKERGYSEKAIERRISALEKIEEHAKTFWGFHSDDLDILCADDSSWNLADKLKNMEEYGNNGSDIHRSDFRRFEVPASQLLSFKSFVREYQHFVQRDSHSNTVWIDELPEGADALVEMRYEFVRRMPDFHNFEYEDSDYFRIERHYKNSIIEEVENLKRQYRSDNETLGRGIIKAMKPSSGPLIRWQTIDQLDREPESKVAKFYEAIGSLVNDEVSAHESVTKCILTLIGLDLPKLPWGEILSMSFSAIGCASPDGSAPFKIRKAQEFYRHLYPGQTIFKDRNNLQADVQSWLGLLEKVKHIMEEHWGWSPKDLFDVQGFAWVVLSDDFKIEEDMEMAEGEFDDAAGIEPTNLILYGPPGTGKTYAMAQEAVRLCDGRVPEGDGGKKSRELVQARYGELYERGRVEFVTFHQSFSYEEFVEGLRPETGVNGDTDSAGFRLQTEDGIFRRIAKRAQEVGRRSGAEVEFERTAVFKTSLGATWDDNLSYLFEECIENDYILLGYGGDVDWSDPEYDNAHNIRARWRDVDPGATNNDPNMVQMCTLRSVMSVGDLVVVSNGNLKFRAIGQITGPYEFERRAEDEYHHRRAVEWLWSDTGEGLAHSDIYEKRFSQQALYKMVDSAIKWPALEEIVSGPQGTAGGMQPYVLIIDEINRANISKVFGELITLLEPDKRLDKENELRVRLPYSKEEFGVPSNLHILATMNTADRSIALLDTALRRRFEFRELLPDPTLLSADVDGIDLQAMLASINERVEYLFDRDHQIGHSYLMGCGSKAEVDAAVRKKIIPLLTEYFYENWEQVRRVLGETTDDGGFITRTQLKAPSDGIEDHDDEPRWRYVVNETFDLSAYDQF